MRYKCNIIALMIMATSKAELTCYYP